MNADKFLDQVLKVPYFIHTNISNDGEKIGFSWKNINPNVDVFYIDLEKKTGPIILTETPEFTRLLDFYPKNNSILVCEDKDRNERMRLFKVNINEPKKMIPLTEENPKYFLNWGGIHPSENFLIYGINYDEEKGIEIEPSWVYKHNLKTNERIAIAKPKKPTWIIPRLNKLGDQIIYDRSDLHPKGTQIWLINFDGTEDREILNFGKESRVKAEWLPDNKKIAFLTDSKGKEEQNYYSFGIYHTENEEIEWIIDEPKRNFESLSVPKNSNFIVLNEIEKARMKSSIVNSSNLEIRELQPKNENLIPLFPTAERKWIGIYYSSTQPYDIVKFNLDNLFPQNYISLTKVWNRTTLKKEDFTQAEDFEWKGKDGLPIHGWLYRPSKPNGKTIVFIHGGPTYHAEDEIIEQIQYFTKRGFLVLAPNYRGSTGYGYTFEDAIRKNGWGSDEQDDIFMSIRVLIEAGLSEKTKIGVTGTSYGGYSSWFAITKAPLELVAAAVPICGMTDLVVDYETTRPDLRTYSEQMLGGSPSEMPERYKERSPINFIDKIKGSVLIVQGLQDPNVTPKNVEAVKQKLIEFKIKHEILEFEDEGHGISKTKNQRILFKRIADFFESTL